MSLFRESTQLRGFSNSDSGLKTFKLPTFILHINKASDMWTNVENTP